MSGEGDDYTDDEADDLYDAIDEALGEGDTGGGGGGGGGGGMDVTARVEWSGEYDNNGQDGKRTVHLDARAVDVNALRDKVNQARPRKSYKAKGPLAQLRQLANTKIGQARLADAGVTPSRETLRRWKLGTQKPSKANRARITEAYKSAQTPSGGSKRAVADQLTNDLRRHYGNNVRFRNITKIRFRR